MLCYIKSGYAPTDHYRGQINWRQALRLEPTVLLVDFGSVNRQVTALRISMSMFPVDTMKLTDTVGFTGHVETVAFELLKVVEEDSYECRYVFSRFLRCALRNSMQSVCLLQLEGATSMIPTTYSP